jgi:hypothetical protein
MSTRIAAAALVACVVVAGCGGVYDEGTTDRATTHATNAERVVAAPPSNGTTTNGAGATVEDADRRDGTTASTEVTGASSRDDAPPETTATRETVETYDTDVGYELRVSNAGGTPRTLTLRVAAVNDSAVAFARTVRLAGNESREFEFDIPHVGTYEARVGLDGTNVTQTWAVENHNPEDALSVHVSPEGEVYVGFVEI